MWVKFEAPGRRPLVGAKLWLSPEELTDTPTCGRGGPDNPANWGDARCARARESARPAGKAPIPRAGPAEAPRRRAQFTTFAGLRTVIGGRTKGWTAEGGGTGSPGRPPGGPCRRRKQEGQGRVGGREDSLACPTPQRTTSAERQRRHGRTRRRGGGRDRPATLPAASYLRGGCPSGFVPGRLRRRMDSASGHGSADRKTRSADRH